MILYNNKHFVTRSDRPNDDWIGNADYVIPDGSELAEKILRLYPNFEIVTDRGGDLINVSETEPAPIPPAPPTDHERLEALETAFTGFASEVMSFLENMGNLGAPLSPKLKNMFEQIKHNNLEEDR